MKTQLTSALITRFHTTLLIAGLLSGLVACSNEQEPAPASTQTTIVQPPLPTSVVPGDGNQKNEQPAVSSSAAALASQPVSERTKQTYQSVRKTAL